MKKIILLVILLMPFNVFGLEIPQLSSDNVIIYDLSNDEVLLNLGSSEVTSIASLTKIMTVMTALEDVEDLSTKVKITDEMLAGIYWNASRAGLKVGDEVTYLDLIYASMLPSGADATNIIAISIAGTLDAYVAKMNDLAKRLDMHNTNFVNVNGLDAKGHYSSAQDILKLLKYALNNKTFKKVYMTKSYTLSNGLRVETTMNNFNEKMNINTDRILGSKTGFTDDAGYCLSSLVRSHNHEILIITLGAKKVQNNFYHIIDTINLIDFVDEELAGLPVVGEVIQDNIVILKDDNLTFRFEVVVIVLASLIIILTIFCNKKKK